MERYIHIDTMIVDLLGEAMGLLNGPYHPSEDTDFVFRPERVATLRLHFWRNLAIGRRAVDQVEATTDMHRRGQLSRIPQIQLPEPDIIEDQRDLLRERVSDLQRLHSDPADCTIVAVAELLKAEALLTMDRNLTRRLSSAAMLPIMTPFGHWKNLGIPRGTQLLQGPDRLNPLADETWWRWDGDSVLWNNAP